MEWLKYRMEEILEPETQDDRSPGAPGTAHAPGDAVDEGDEGRVELGV